MSSPFPQIHDPVVEVDYVNGYDYYEYFHKLSHKPTDNFQLLVYCFFTKYTQPDMIFEYRILFLPMSPHRIHGDYRFR
jgi:hypothetical protein